MRCFLTGVLVLALLAPVSSLSAQGFREAEIDFNRGELLLEMRDYPRAIFALKKAYSIVPDNRYLAVLTRAYAAKGDGESALVYGELYLQREREKPRQKVIDLVGKLRSDLADSSGEVLVRLFPSQGKLTVLRADGERDSRIVSESEVSRWLPLGQTTIIYEKDGFAPKEIDVSVDKGKLAEVDVILERAAGEGELVVEANVAHAQVYVDGQPVGAVPLRTSVEAGDHVVQVWTENHLAWTGVVDVAPSRSVSVTAKLTPSKTPVAAIPTHRIIVDEKSSWTLSTWGWITMGVGVAAFGAAGYLYKAAMDKAAEANNVKGKEQDDLLADAQTMWFGMMGSAAVGGGAVGGGLLMILLDDSKDDENAAAFELLTLSPAILPNGAGLNAVWTF